MIPQDNEHFIWDVHCDTNRNQKLLCSVGGRKNKAVVSIDEVLEASEGDEPSVHIVTKKSFLPEKLHRLRSNQSRLSPFYAKTIGFEEAKAFRKAQGSYLRANQWDDLTVDVYLEYE